MTHARTHTTISYIEILALLNVKRPRLEIYVALLIYILEEFHVALKYISVNVC